MDLSTMGETELPVDPMAALRADPAYVDAYLGVVCRDAEARGGLAGETGLELDESDLAAPPVVKVDAVDRHLGHLIDTTLQSRAMTARQDLAISNILQDAATDPDPWVGPDPTLDALFVLPAHTTTHSYRVRRREMAVRAAVADIAVRLHASELSVRGRAHRANVLVERCPQVWELCLGGLVPEQNMRTAAQLADSLPTDDPQSWREFDTGAASVAATTAPGRFSARARTIRERAHRESVTERHRRAAKDRGVWFTPALDGMASFEVFGPAADLQRLMTELDRRARHLAAQEGEERTIAQLRADVLCDLVTEPGPSASTPPPVSGKPSVSITVPALTLMGLSDEPATLDGYGPIDLDTARRLAGEATSWIRVLTHPVTGTMLDIDRKSYRVPASLRRWLGVTSPHCTFPGCGRPASDCEIDHRKPWAEGGTTSAENTWPLCSGHHHLRHESCWRFEDDEYGTAWVSPTGHRTYIEPPPF